MVEGQASKQLIDFIMKEDYSGLHCSLDRSIREKGWKITKNNFILSLKNICNNRWLTINWTLLRIFDSEELIGYDGDILKIVSNIDDIENTRELRGRTTSDLLGRLLI